MSTNGLGNGVDSWGSPKTVVALGVTGFLTVFLILVITGVIPTPLMTGQTLIPEVKAEVVGLKDYLKAIYTVVRANCENEADSTEKFKNCTKDTPDLPGEPL